jgi:hypothetical protein
MCLSGSVSNRSHDRAASRVRLLVPSTYQWRRRHVTRARCSPDHRIVRTKKLHTLMVSTGIIQPTWLGENRLTPSFFEVFMSQTICPGCGGSAVNRTPSRTPVERFRRLFTSKRPHRCRRCAWSGWIEVSPRTRHANTWTVEREPPDLGAVDVALLPDSIDGGSRASARSHLRDQNAGDRGGL